MLCNIFSEQIYRDICFANNLFAKSIPTVSHEDSIIGKYHLDKKENKYNMDMLPDCCIFIGQIYPIDTFVF